MATALALAGIPAMAGAQVRGMPVVNNAAGTGVGVAAGLGFSNEAAGGGTALGASAGAGVGPLHLTGAISRTKPDNGSTVWSQGVSVSMGIFGGPLVPFKVSLQGGAGFWNAGVLDGLHIPISVGFAANIPFPAFAIRPWLAPRVDIARESINEVGDTHSNFGISGGIELGFIGGLSVQASYDKLFVDGDSPGIFGIGVGFGLGL